MRRWLVNGFILIVAIAAVVALAAGLYRTSHAHGLIEGRVIGPHGEGIPGATVTLSEPAAPVGRPVAHTTTEADGWFVFRGRQLSAFVLDASKDGVGRAGPITVHLYFRGQDHVMRRPIQLEPPTHAARRLSTGPA